MNPQEPASSGTPQPQPTPDASPTPSPAPSPAPRAQRGWVSLPILLLGVAVLGLAGVGAAYYAIQSIEQPANYLAAIKLSLTSPTRLDSGFTDANGDLVADAPSDASKLVNPEKLIFVPLGFDLTREKETWKDFLAHVTKVTGKPVELVIKQYNTLDDLAALKDGKDHIVCLSTGSVPTAVNLGGFVPLCVMSDDQGNFGFQVQFIVPSSSKIKDLKDLRGSKIAMGSMRSHSAFKAPVVMLYEKVGLLPGRDFQISIGNRQDLVIKAVTENRAEVAPVASDLVKRMVSQDDVKDSQFRTIFTMETSFPPACYGIPYNLNTDLAKKIQTAFETFSFKGTSLEKAFAAANQTKFTGISYKKDWESTRQVDETINKLVGVK